MPNRMMGTACSAAYAQQQAAAAGKPLLTDLHIKGMRTVKWSTWLLRKPTTEGAE